jgi:chromosome segregation ATPase
MFEYQNIEDHSEKIETKLHLLELQIEALDKEIHQFLTDLKITPEKLTYFIENENYFTQENWKTLQVERKTLEEKLQISLKNILDPRKTKKTYAERHAGSSWLFVK